MKAEGVRNIEQLIELSKLGVRLKYSFFWGHTPKIPNHVDQSCLSNWFPAAFVVEDIKYETAEHYMMAQKARLFGDTAVESKILAAPSPGEAKKLGRSISNFDEVQWQQHRFDIVVNGCFEKFSQNQPLADLLAKTGSKIIVEASPSDQIWGIGLSRDHDDANTPENWRGENLLGFALMEVRSRLIS